MTANEEELIEQAYEILRPFETVEGRIDAANLGLRPPNYAAAAALVDAGWRPPLTGDVADMLDEGLSTEAIRKLEDESYDRGEDAGYTDGYGQGYADGVASAGITCSGVR